MTKDQYRAVIRSMKETRKTKLIHLLINYRSHNDTRYPLGFVQVMMQIKKGQKLFDGDGLWLFQSAEQNYWCQPQFYTRYYTRGNFIREIESEIPF